ncbi:unnamed protein product [Rhizoctonia solani]|uniref:Uncharacterized protein n=1 Tax=Rhizoctonia solani TaxID=456999 RepID=A0A8H3EB89_9AGAM|nr:unnamed protein product [Rhizoctonia solani]
MNTFEEGKHTFRLQVFNQAKATTNVPSPSQAETLMSTQEAKERAESKSKLAEKGKARETQTTPATTRSQLAGSAPKPTNPQTNAPVNSPQMNSTTGDKPTSASTGGTLNVPTPQPPRTVTAPDTPNALTPKNTLPLKRGPGRPRKSDVNTGPPPAKRPRGRPRNVTTPASLFRQRNEATDEDGPNAENDEDSDYHDSSDEAVIPPHILAQFNAHVTLLRTRLDSRGIPEQYSIYKAFWMATRSAYFDTGTNAPPGRFFYWDPLFITSVGCPVCQQPLAIAAGGGWLDAPLCLHDEDGPCWIIGRRYVCTQCFVATEEAAKYVQVPSTNPGASDADGETKPKVPKPDFSSPVYYLSWEKRFRALLPPTLAAEFPKPKRAEKRAAFNRASLGIGMASSGDGDVDMDAEGEPDGDVEDEGISKRSRRVRHCMKSGLRYTRTGAKDVDELRERARRELEAEKIRQRAEKVAVEPNQSENNAPKGNNPPTLAVKARKDSSPIKPLDTILNLSKLSSSSPPLTSAQLGALWTAYHARKEGVLCAVVPLDIYNQLLERARQYGQFVVPLPRGSKPAEGRKEAEGGTEMFFIEWAVHHSPTLPNPNVDELGLPTSQPAESPTPKGSNPPITTLLFTPLQEYKHRQSFAAPHLALTLYTDLAATHGVVLLRGEITPAQSGDGRWLLGQEEAQALVVAMQKFYLPGTGEGAKEREELLKCFHERPEEFKWERLLELSDIGIKL